MKRVFIEDIEVIIEHKPRNKNSYITVSNDGAVRLKTPLKLSFRINSLLRDRLEWIKAKRLHVRDKKSMQYILGESIILDGELIFVSQISQLQKKIERLHVRDNASLERCYNRFYLESSQDDLPIHVRQLSQEIGLFPSKLRFRKMKRQWGNCNAHGVITLNTALMKLTLRQRRYVIAHELCHLVHMNHSRDFYSLLYGFFPEASKIEQELKMIRF